MAAYHEVAPDAAGDAAPAYNPFASLGKVAGGVGNALAIYQGLQRGGLSGYGSAAINAGSLANKAGAFGGSASLAGGALGAAGGALGLYNGLKEKGGLGYTNAALGAANLLGGIGTLAGGAAAGGLGSLAAISSFAGPLGLALAPILMGAASQPWTYNGDYANRMQSYINAGPGAFANAGQQYGGSIYNGFNGLYWDPQYADYMAATTNYARPVSLVGGGGPQGGNLASNK